MAAWNLLNILLQWLKATGIQFEKLLGGRCIRYMKEQQPAFGM